MWYQKLLLISTSTKFKIHFKLIQVEKKIGLVSVLQAKRDYLLFQYNYQENPMTTDKDTLKSPSSLVKKTVKNKLLTVISDKI